MLHAVYLVERPTLLDDLLEDSARIYHRHCTIIQNIFHGQWLKTLGEHVGCEQIEFPDEPAAQVEKRIRNRLATYRKELRLRQADLISEEREKHTGRDRAIRSYVASLRAQEQAA